MSDAAALPLVVVFGLLTVFLVRSRDVRWWEATLITLFGVYLGQTPVVFTINGLTSLLFTGHAPAQP
ncbi:MULTISPECIES: hypothetical protein [Streptomyces]|uniref:hypothetical protein n=1 Tax=Streptomyces TaxID=1883 RepID=UPI00200D3F0A|nr:hypothetical protein [Streptomyces sp. HU2014]UQI42982.1 hypothetical protein M1P56_00560 [Streptomyces sp. HU2014]UQI48911.1 hypothetical protein M1P56_33670 [Streptomyces sp. HU2014]